MEKLIHSRLNFFLKSSNILSNSQFGFRRGRSCADNLAILATEIWSGFVAGEVTAGLFLDLKGAFPSVIPQILIEDLRELGIPWQIAKFIYNTNFSKNIYFKINGELIGPRVNLVVLPQGCILSPIMYAVYTRRLQSFVPNNCVIIEFADDIALLCRSATPEICRNALQRCLDEIVPFLNRRGLEICPEKTRLLLFLRRNEDSSNLTLSIGDSTIDTSRSVKFLGMLLNEKFTFEDHFMYICNRIRKILNVIKVLRGTW